MRRNRLPQTRKFLIEQPLRSCLMRLDVRCSIECCGIHALKASPVLIQIWAESVGKEKTTAALNQARGILALLSETKELLSCAFLNYREHGEIQRAEFQEFLRELIAALEACA